MSGSMTNAEDIDGLAAEYVLGSLDPVERMEVAARRHGEPALNDAIKAWERRLGPLTDLVPPSNRQVTFFVTSCVASTTSNPRSLSKLCPGVGGGRPLPLGRPRWPRA